MGEQAAQREHGIAGEGRPVGLWLLPAENHYGIWAALIQRLASLYASPVFEPHVSLQAGVQGTNIDLEACTQQIAARHRAVELPVLGLDHGAALFKSVFARLPTEPLSALSAELGTLMADPPGFVLDAHLSLIYAELSEHERQRLCASLALPETRTTFDRLAVVEPGVGESDFSRIDRWRITAVVPLALPPLGL